MGFRIAYGYAYSENGWRMIDINSCDSTPPPRLPNLHLPVHNGDAGVVLKAWVTWFSENVESLNNPGRGFSDEGCWTNTNDVGNSNHLSGTAVDLNWSLHNFRQSYSGFDAGEISRTRQGLAAFRSCIWWGQDWSSPKDPMHFQLNFGQDDARIVALAKDLRGGYLGIYSGSPVQPPPIVVVPIGNTTIDLEYGSTGPQVAALQAGFNKVFPSYRNCPLVVDGDFGPATQGAVKEFQNRAGLTVDGIVGPNTAAALARYGVKI
jgi:hypothetical protein